VTTTQLEYWHKRPFDIARDQHPGCHTHASGFDYVPFENPADEEIDKCWSRERREARQELLQRLRERQARLFTREASLQTSARSLAHDSSA
jgi:hypothetical protein